MRPVNVEEVPGMGLPGPAGRPAFWVGEDVVIHPTALVGRPAQWRERWNQRPAWDCVPELDDGCDLGAFVVVEAGAQNATRIGKRVRIMNLCQIGHDTVIGDDVEVASMCNLQGFTTVGAGAKIGGGVTTVPCVTIGRGAVIGAGAVVTRDVPDGETWAGCPARLLAQLAGTAAGPVAGWE